MNVWAQGLCLCLRHLGTPGLWPRASTQHQLRKCWTILWTLLQGSSLQRRFLPYTKSPQYFLPKLALRVESSQCTAPWSRGTAWTDTEYHWEVLDFILKIHVSLALSFVSVLILFWYKNVFKSLIIFPKIYGGVPFCYLPALGAPCMGLHI